MKLRVEIDRLERANQFVIFEYEMLGNYSAVVQQRVVAVVLLQLIILVIKRNCETRIFEYFNDKNCVKAFLLQVEVQMKTCLKLL